MKYLTLIIIPFFIMACEKTTALTGQNLNPLSPDPKTNNILLSTDTHLYQIVPDADVGAWILNTKTGETQHCWTNSYGLTPLCVVAEHREEVKRK
jgi:hypothetical protein